MSRFDWSACVVKNSIDRCLHLVTPGNPQRCNSTIAEESIQLHFYVGSSLFIHYRLTNWLMFLCGQIQSPRPDVMPDRREDIARAEGFVSARIETSAS